jgi:hypothetical protein
MKGLILFTAAIYLVIAIPNSQAGIAGVISESTRILNGSNCDEPNSAGVKLCRDKDGAIYYEWNGNQYKEYPNKANEEYMKKQKATQ